VEALECRLATFEERASAQLKEACTGLGAVRVKVDGQAQRTSALAERLETAFVPSLEALKADLAEERARDLRNSEGRFAELSRRIDFACEAAEGDCPEKVEALVPRVASCEASCGATRREVQELRAALRAELRAVMGRSSRGGSSAASGGSGSELPSEAKGALAGPTIKDQLAAVADQLESVDEVVGEVRSLDRRVTALERRGTAAEGKATPVAVDGTVAAVVAQEEVDKVVDASSVPEKKEAALPGGSRPPAGLSKGTAPQLMPQRPQREMERSDCGSRRTSVDSTASCDLMVSSYDDCVASTQELENKCYLIEEVQSPVQSPQGNGQTDRRLELERQAASKRSGGSRGSAGSGASEEEASQVSMSVPESPRQTPSEILSD